MKVSALFFIIFAFMLTVVSAQEEQVDQQEMMKKWQEYMTPGDVHKHMQTAEGEWNADMKFWMAPGTEPAVSTGETSIKMILGGRYLQMTHKGVVMGMPTEGMSIESYDNDKKEFTSIWIDNMGTGMMISKGTISDDMKTINYSGLMYDPMSGSDIKTRQVSTMVDENTMKFEMFQEFNGAEFKSMEILYNRK